MAKKHQLLRTHTLGSGWTLRPDGEADDRPGIRHWFVHSPCGGTASLGAAEEQGVVVAHNDREVTIPVKVYDTMVAAAVELAAAGLY